MYSIIYISNKQPITLNILELQTRQKQKKCYYF